MLDLLSFTGIQEGKDKPLHGDTAAPSTSRDSIPAKPTCRYHSATSAGEERSLQYEVSAGYCGPSVAALSLVDNNEAKNPHGVNGSRLQGTRFSGGHSFDFSSSNSHQGASARYDDRGIGDQQCNIGYEQGVFAPISSLQDLVCDKSLPGYYVSLVPTARGSVILGVLPAAPSNVKSLTFPVRRTEEETTRRERSGSSTILEAQESNKNPSNNDTGKISGRSAVTAEIATNNGNASINADTHQDVMKNSAVGVIQDVSEVHGSLTACSGTGVQDEDGATPLTNQEVARKNAVALNDPDSQGKAIHPPEMLRVNEVRPHPEYSDSVAEAAAAGMEAVDRYSSQVGQRQVLHCMFCPYQTAWKGPLASHEWRYHRELVTPRREESVRNNFLENSAGKNSDMTQQGGSTGEISEMDSTSVMKKSIRNNCNGNVASVNTEVVPRGESVYDSPGENDSSIAPAQGNNTLPKRKQFLVPHHVGIAAAPPAEKERKQKIPVHLVQHRSPPGVSSAATLFSCTLCDFRCEVEITWRQHMKCHKRRGRFKCSRCSYRSNMLRYKDVHEQLYHRSMENSLIGKENEKGKHNSHEKLCHQPEVKSLSGDKQEKVQQDSHERFNHNPKESKRIPGEKQEKSEQNSNNRLNHDPKEKKSVSKGKQEQKRDSHDEKGVGKSKTDSKVCDQNKMALKNLAKEGCTMNHHTWTVNKKGVYSCTLCPAKKLSSKGIKMHIHVSHCWVDRWKWKRGSAEEWNSSVTEEEKSDQDCVKCKGKDLDPGISSDVVVKRGKEKVCVGHVGSRNKQTEKRTGQLIMESNGIDEFDHDGRNESNCNILKDGVPGMDLDYCDFCHTERSKPTQNRRKKGYKSKKGMQLTESHVCTCKRGFRKAGMTAEALGDNPQVFGKTPCLKGGGKSRPSSGSSGHYPYSADSQNMNSICPSSERTSFSGPNGEAYNPEVKNSKDAKVCSPAQNPLLPIDRFYRHTSRDVAGSSTSNKARMCSPMKRTAPSPCDDTSSGVNHPPPSKVSRIGRAMKQITDSREDAKIAKRKASSKKTKTNITKNEVQEAFSSGDGAIFACDHCPYRAKDSAILQRHLLGHAGQGKHVCDLCSYSTNRNATLLKHRVVHFNIPKFYCQSGICVTEWQQNG